MQHRSIVLILLESDLFKGSCVRYWCTYYLRTIQQWILVCHHYAIITMMTWEWWQENDDKRMMTWEWWQQQWWQENDDKRMMTREWWRENDDNNNDDVINWLRYQVLVCTTVLSRHSPRGSSRNHRLRAIVFSTQILTEWPCSHRIFTTHLLTEESTHFN